MVLLLYQFIKRLLRFSAGTLIGLEIRLIMKTIVLLFIHLFAALCCMYTQSIYFALFHDRFVFHISWVRERGPSV